MTGVVSNAASAPHPDVALAAHEERVGEQSDNGGVVGYQSGGGRGSGASPV